MAYPLIFLFTKNTAIARQGLKKPQKECIILNNLKIANMINY